MWIKNPQLFFNPSLKNRTLSEQRTTWGPESEQGHNIYLVPNFRKWRGGVWMGFRCVNLLFITLCDILPLTLLQCNICTCRYLSCSAADDSVITSEASLKALLAFCSPSAAITCGMHHHWYFENIYLGLKGTD